MVRGMGAVGSMVQSLADWGGGGEFGIQFRIQSLEFRVMGRGWQFSIVNFQFSVTLATYRQFVQPLRQDIAP